MNEFLLLAQLIKNGEFEEVDSTYLKELKEQLGQAIYPINKVYFYVDGSLQDSWTIEELQERLAKHNIDQKLYIDKAGTILYLPNPQGYWNGSITITNSDDITISYDKHFTGDVLYRNGTAIPYTLSLEDENGNPDKFLLLNLRVYESEEEAGSGREAPADTFNSDGQYVNVVFSFTSLA